MRANLIICLMAGVLAGCETLLSADPNPKSHSNLSRKAILIDQAQSIVRGRFPDPKSAKFKKFFVNRASLPVGEPVSIVCDQVDAKNVSGNYLGYQGFIASSHLLVFAALENNFLNSREFRIAWNRWCK